MPYINLIHEERVFQKTQERKVRLAMAGLLTVAGLSVVGAGTILLMTADVNGETAEVRSLLSRIQPVVRDIEDSQKELSILGPRLTTLQQAQDITMHWSRALDHFSYHTPKGVWLTNIKSQRRGKDGAVEVSLTGTSLTQQAVGDLMLRMKPLPDFENVNLKFTQEDRKPTLNTIRFEVIAEITGSKEEAEKKPAKKSLGDKRKEEKEASAS